MFRKVGASRQPSILNAADMKKIIELDHALWAVNSIPKEAIVSDDEFLTFLDSDGNGRIRPNELREGLKWLLGILKDYSGIDSASDVLKLASFDDEHPESATLKSSIQLILSNLHRAGETEISLADLRNTNSIIGAGNSNGDGIVTLENTEDEDIARTIGNVMKICGSKTDLSTLQGVDDELVSNYVALGTARLEWLKTGVQLEMESIYREKAGGFFQSYIKVKDKLDEFFLLCGALANDSDDRFANQLKIDPLNIASVQDFIKNAPAAQLASDRTLNMNKWVNPLILNDLQNFMAIAYDTGSIADKAILTEKEYNVISSTFAERLKWSTSVTDEKFAGMTIEDLEKDLAEANINKLRDLIKYDLSVATEIKSLQQLRKLALYQKYMLRFVNNFVSLSELFDPNLLSMIQPGYLVMDGRYFSLNVCVSNLAEHKKIIQRSNICVMYINLETTVANTVKKMTIATAITSGTMRNIFIGKCGIFYAGDGTEYDAKVIDLIQQPVSFVEALLQPFYSLGNFMTKQADKFFSTRSKDVESAVNKQVNTAAKSDAGKLMNTQEVRQTPAISGSMMLMGGGVGLAALGSSVAFITNTLKGVPVWNIAAVLFGIAFTISAPMMLVSIIKLQNRRISDFFAAGGWAVNLQMRLSRKMGLLFTRKPHIPLNAILRGDLINMLKYEGVTRKKK